jgi:hypothetical protein
MREGKYRKIKDTGNSREEMTKKEKMKRKKKNNGNTIDSLKTRITAMSSTSLRPYPTK